jgi:hypothetical protein
MGAILSLVGLLSTGSARLPGKGRFLTSWAQFILGFELLGGGPTGWRTAVPPGRQREPGRRGPVVKPPVIRPAANRSETRAGRASGGDPGKRPNSLRPPPGAAG